MENATTDLKGSTLYRIGFAVFVIGCLMNSFEAYKDYIHDTNFGSPSPEGMYQAWSFLGLSVILVLEGVGLVMFKWAKRHVGLGATLSDAPARH
ncbi:MAG TPA: hypothetical protein VM008_22460 [Phycisphaerae bacterium]|nr:hypothetical protein [Phycisphaerae bacterium]